MTDTPQHPPHLALVSAEGEQPRKGRRRKPRQPGSLKERASFGDLESILNDLVRLAGIAMDYAIPAAERGNENASKALCMIEVVEEKAKAACDLWYRAHKEAGGA